MITNNILWNNLKGDLKTDQKKPLLKWRKHYQVYSVPFSGFKLLISGSGLGLMYLPSLVMVGHYFKKKRALATGIAVCGSGVGGFVFAPLSELLLDLYTWRGAMWVLSAICLNGMVAGALFRPINTVTNNTDAQDINHTVQIRSGERKCAKNLNKKECCGFYSLFDLSLLKSPTFLVYGIVCFLFNLGTWICAHSNTRFQGYANCKYPYHIAHMHRLVRKCTFHILKSTFKHSHGRGANAL